MNERIKELAKKCYETGPIGKDGWPEYSKFNEDKFAELLVKECNEVLRQVPYNSNVEFGDEVIYQDAIRKHFGVEE